MKAKSTSVKSQQKEFYYDVEDVLEEEKIKKKKITEYEEIEPSENPSSKVYESYPTEAIELDDNIEIPSQTEIYNETDVIEDENFKEEEYFEEKVTKDRGYEDHKINRNYDQEYSRDNIYQRYLLKATSEKEFARYKPKVKDYHENNKVNEIHKIYNCFSTDVWNCLLLKHQNRLHTSFRQTA